MKVTDIRQQVKRADRYAIYIDGKYTFSLGETELLTAELKLNQELSKDDLASLKQKALLDKAFDRSLNLISRRRRSIWEMRDYLKRKNYSEENIKTTLNKLSVSGYLDDEVFAKAWVENRRLLKSTSKRRLQQELRQKRVDDEIIKQVLESDETDELVTLRDLIARKRKQTRYQDEMKLMQYLVRQGYNYGDIKTVLSENESN